MIANPLAATGRPKDIGVATATGGAMIWPPPMTPGKPLPPIIPGKPPPMTPGKPPPPVIGNLEPGSPPAVMVMKGWPWS